MEGGGRECWSEGVLESWGGQSALLRRAGGWRSKEGPGSERRWEKVGGKWVDLGKGGRVAGKRTGFPHLGPDNSTQVVDFPRICSVSIFLGGVKNSRISGRGMIGRGMEMEGQAEVGTHMGNGVLECRGEAKVTGCYALFRESSRSFTKVRTEQARKSAMLRIVTGKTNFLSRKPGKRERKRKRDQRRMARRRDVSSILSSSASPAESGFRFPIRNVLIKLAA